MSEREIRYAAFDPEIWLTKILRRDEQWHFAASYGFLDELPRGDEGQAPTVQELEKRMERTFILLELVREEGDHPDWSQVAINRFKRRLRDEANASILVIANSADQARGQMERVAPEMLTSARVIDTHSSDGTRLLGALYPPENIILTEGWERGRHAQHVEDMLRRNLAARGDRFEDCTRVEDDALITADVGR